MPLGVQAVRQASTSYKDLEHRQSQSRRRPLPGTHGRLGVSETFYVMGRLDEMGLSQDHENWSRAVREGPLASSRGLSLDWER